MRRRLATILAVGALLGGMLVTGSVVLAANQAANLDQCANDPAPSPNTDGCNSAASQWVNGNLGSSKSSYFEGDTIPYRMTVTNLVPGATIHHLTIEWDTTKGGKHAIDYLTTFNQTVANANPCLGVSGCAPGSFGISSTIPTDPQVAGAGVTPIAGVFRLYGGTITSLSRPTSVGSTTCTAANSLGSYCYSVGTGFTGDKSAAITINFTASVGNPVLAWGGHIATRANWGQGNSAGAVSGSPYHMRLIDLDGAGGNQDRSLSADAVTLPATMTIIKDVLPGTDPQDFTFTETGSTTLGPTSFILDDDADATRSNSQSYATGSSTTNFTSYTFTEGALGNWTVSFPAPFCTVTSPNGGSQTSSVATRSITIDLKEGENVTCTFSNTHTVNTTTLTTTTNITTGNIGATLTDSATLGGATVGATGTINFYLFAPGATCDDTAPISGFVYSATGVPVSGNGTYLSANATGTSGSNLATAAGTYTWVAVYSGDGNNASSKSSCGSEDVTISPNTTTLTTTTNITTGNIGATLTDSATLSGATVGATGTINFYLFAPGATCNLTGVGAVYSSTGVPVSGNGTYLSANGVTKVGSNTATAAGTYTWSAVYTDGNNNASSHSTCGSEDVVIGSNTTHLSTTPSELTGGIGDTLTDTATLTGATAGAGGTISFYLFAPGATCDDTTPISGFVYSATGVPVTGNNTYLSANSTGTTGSNVTTGAGTYTWVAVYSGDSNNTGSKSACGSEDVVIGPNTPGLVTDTDPDSGGIGDTLNDTATLSGATSSAGGTISFYLFAPGVTCATDGTGAVYSSTGIAVSGNDTYLSTAGTESGSNVTTGAGTYTWVAVYSGDSNNTGTNTDCGDEDVVIGPNTPGLVTDTDPDSGGIGDTLNDTATLSGATSSAGGTISFYLFAPGVTCATDGTGAVYSSTGIAVSGNDTYLSTAGTESGSNVTTGAGTYTWVAVYSGDSNNTGTNTDCGDEDVVISPNTPDISTTPTLQVQDAVTIGNLAPVATFGNLTVKLVDGVDCDGTTLYSKVWYGHDNPGGEDAFTGNDTYSTGTVTVNADATLRWCTAYEGDVNNAARDFADDNEVVSIDFLDPIIWSAGGFGLALPILLWSAWRRRRNED